jgi:hypothetical protein
MIKLLISKFFNLFSAKKNKKQASFVNKQEIFLSFEKCNANIVADVIISEGKKAVYVATISGIKQVSCKKAYPEEKLYSTSISGDSLNVISAGTLPDSDDLNMFVEISVNNVCLYIMRFKALHNIKQSGRSVLADCLLDYIKVINVLGQTYH